MVVWSMTDPEKGQALPREVAGTLASWFLTLASRLRILRARKRRLGVAVPFRLN
jgi:hypothetical protein